MFFCLPFVNTICQYSNLLGSLGVRRWQISLLSYWEYKRRMLYVSGVPVFDAFMTIYSLLNVCDLTQSFSAVFNVLRSAVPRSTCSPKCVCWSLRHRNHLCLWNKSIKTKHSSIVDIVAMMTKLQFAEQISIFNSLLLIVNIGSKRHTCRGHGSITFGDQVLYPQMLVSWFVRPSKKLFWDRVCFLIWWAYQWVRGFIVLISKDIKKYFPWIRGRITSVLLIKACHK